MPEATTKQEYTDFIVRIRQGDEQAAEELVRRFEPEIRMEVRGWLRLRNPGLRRVFDSMDICQSVLASFFARAAVGDFDLDEPPQLIRLLVGMARKKVAEQARHHQRQRRDVRRVGDGNVEDAPVTAADQTPSRLASGRELLQKFRELLTDEERQIADLRTRGTDWAGVAAELGGTPDGRRKQLARAVARIELELGLGSMFD
jgi:DNA-directed RNA polymerase specialized sigma24 family protein